MQATLDAQNRERTGATHTHLLLVLRSDGELEMEQLRVDMATRAQAAGIPVFHELTNAARALSALRSDRTSVASKTRLVYKISTVDIGDFASDPVGSHEIDDRFGNVGTDPGGAPSDSGSIISGRAL